MKKSILLVLSTLTLSVLAGILIPTSLAEFREVLAHHLGDVPDSAAGLFWAIFCSNSLFALCMFGLGVLFVLLPFPGNYMVAIPGFLNFTVNGFVLGSAVQVLPTVLGLRMLAYGWLELGVFVVAFAYGLSRPAPGRGEWKLFLAKTAAFCSCAAFALAISAGIETYIIRCVEQVA